jgi:DNA-binding transcriptional ArsR family regulator
MVVENFSTTVDGKAHPSVSASAIVYANPLERSGVMTQTETSAKQTTYSPGLNAALFKALGHPLRYPILLIAADREVTPTELAEMLGEPFQRVYAQVRAMASGDVPLLKLVDTDTRKGGAMHYYRAMVRPILDATAWEELPQLAREAWSAVTLGIVIGELAESVRAERFDAHPNRIAVRRPIHVDRAGAVKIEEAAIKYDEACLEAEAESGERAEDAGTEDDRAEMLSVTLLFERASV